MDNRSILTQIWKEAGKSAQEIATLATLPDFVIDNLLDGETAARKLSEARTVRATARGAGSADTMPVEIIAQQEALARKCAQAATDAWQKTEADAVKQGQTPLLYGMHFQMRVEGRRWTTEIDNGKLSIILVPIEGEPRFGAKLNLVGLKSPLFCIDTAGWKAGNSELAKQFGKVRRDYPAETAKAKDKATAESDATVETDGDSDATS